MKEDFIYTTKTDMVYGKIGLVSHEDFESMVTANLRLLFINRMALHRSNGKHYNAVPCQQMNK